MSENNEKEPELTDGPPRLPGTVWPREGERWPSVPWGPGEGPMFVCVVETAHGPDARAWSGAAWVRPFDAGRVPVFAAWAMAERARAEQAEAMCNAAVEVSGNDMMARAEAERRAERAEADRDAARGALRTTSADLSEASKGLVFLRDLLARGESGRDTLAEEVLRRLAEAERPVIEAARALCTWGPVPHGPDCAHRHCDDCEDGECEETDEPRTCSRVAEDVLRAAMARIGAGGKP